MSGNKGDVYELPINTYSFMKNKIIFSGGGYFRLLPWCLLNKLFSKSDYVMTYFHPHDFDSGKPLLDNMSYLSRFRRKYGVSNCMHKLQKMLESFNFLSVKEYVNINKSSFTRSHYDPDEPI